MAQTQEYQVKLEIRAVTAVGAEEVEDMLERLVDELIERAPGLALGPAGAIHGTTVELGFTVEANDTAEMYSKLHKIALILEDTGTLDLAATTARRDDRELVLA